MEYPRWGVYAIWRYERLTLLTSLVQEELPIAVYHIKLCEALRFCRLIQLGVNEWERKCLWDCARVYRTQVDSKPPFICPCLRDEVSRSCSFAVRVGINEAGVQKFLDKLAQELFLRIIVASQTNENWLGVGLEVDLHWRDLSSATVVEVESEHVTALLDDGS